MLAIQIIFWASVFIVFYSYIGYGMLLWLLVKLNGNRAKFSGNTTFTPHITLLVAAFNESDFIDQKIQNSLGLNYPKDKLDLIIVADGSSDDTPQKIKAYPQVQLFFEPERKGKSMAINRVMPFIKTDIVVFSDANTLLNEDCLLNIVQHYQNPKVGAVAGEKVVSSTGQLTNIAGEGEGLYWKYESFLKKLDAQFYSVVGAAGELFSIRTQLFEHVDKNVLLDDFIISMKICQKGYRVMYEPRAFATEAPSFSMQEEQKRKIRISAGGFQSVVMLKDLLNIFKYGKLSFQYISHRVLRWVVCPWLLPIIFITNLLLLKSGGWLYSILFVSQCLFYAAALAGWLLAKAHKKVKLLYVAYYFVFMNWALYLGFVRFLSNKQSVLWDKARRADVPIG